MLAMTQKYLTAYLAAITQHGATFPSLLWASRETQEARFATLVRLAGLRERSPSCLLDVGCGMGDLLGWLRKRRVKFRSYLGIDAIAELIAVAQGRAAIWGTTQDGEMSSHRFEVLDPLVDATALAARSVDWVIISGTLNTMDQDDAERLMEICLTAARVGVAFNFLSDQPDAYHLTKALGPARRHSTTQWLSWALRRSPLVAFEQRHLGGHDAAIVIEHIAP